MQLLRRKSAVRWLALLSFVLAQVGCNSGGSSKYASPDAVFNAAKSAVEKKDYSGFARCLTPQSQKSFAGALVMGAVMVKMFSGLAAMGGEDAKKEADAEFAKIDDVLKKHGLSDEVLKSMEEPGDDQSNPEEAIQKLTAPIKDNAAFIGDMMAAFEAMDDKKGGGPTGTFLGSLKDLKIEGDSATAAVVMTKDGEDQEEPIEFKKIDGGWLIEIPQGALGPGGGGDGPM